MHIQAVVEELATKGVAIESTSEPIFSGDRQTTRLMVAIMSVLSQMERERISRRTRDALAKKNADGERLGAPRLEDSPEKVAKIKKAQECRVRGMSFREIGRLLEVDASTAMRWCKREDLAQ